MNFSEAERCRYEEGLILSEESGAVAMVCLQCTCTLIMQAK